MKRLCIFIFCVFASSVFAQNKIVEQKQRTENGITKGWTITKELDTQGNVVSYDSAYFERDAAESGSMQFNFNGSDGNTAFQFFNFGSDSLDMNSFYHSFGFGDSTLQQLNQNWTDFDEYLREYQRRMEQLLHAPVDSIPGGKDLFIFPEGSPPTKKI